MFQLQNYNEGENFCITDYRYGVMRLLKILEFDELNKKIQARKRGKPKIKNCSKIWNLCMNVSESSKILSYFPPWEKFLGLK